MSRLVAHSRIFRLFRKGKFDAYCDLCPKEFKMEKQTSLLLATLWYTVYFAQYLLTSYMYVQLFIENRQAQMENTIEPFLCFKSFSSKGRKFANFIRRQPTNVCCKNRGFGAIDQVREMSERCKSSLNKCQFKSQPPGLIIPVHKNKYSFESMSNQKSIFRTF